MTEENHDRRMAAIGSIDEIIAANWDLVDDITVQNEELGAKTYKAVVDKINHYPTTTIMVLHNNAVFKGNNLVSWMQSGVKAGDSIELYIATPSNEHKSSQIFEELYKMLTQKRYISPNLFLDEVVSYEISVGLEDGVHMRPAEKISDLNCEYPHTVRIIYKKSDDNGSLTEYEVDGKSIVQVSMLAIGYGHSFILRAQLIRNMEQLPEELAKNVAAIVEGTYNRT